MMIRFIFFFICLSLTGCGLSKRQAQNLADGLAGIEAAEQRVSADPVAAATLAGAHDHVEAIAEGELLPPPKRSAAAIIADPTGYAADAQQAVQDAQTTVPWWGWIIGVSAAALGALRFIPGTGGAVADIAWRLLAPRRDKLIERERDENADQYRTFMQILEHISNDDTIATLKAQMAERHSHLPKDVRNKHADEFMN
jgi:hypothetical protein